MSANSSKYIYGGDIMYFISSGSTKYPLCFSTSANLSMTAEMLERKTKDSGNWKEVKPVTYSFEGGSEGTMNYEATGNTQGIETLFNYWKGGLSVNFAFASKTGTTPSWQVDSSLPSFSGTVYIASIQLTAGDGSDATYSVSFTGSGELNLTL
jgi:hypothetical protein